MTSSRRICLRAVEWRMEQATAETRREMRRGLHSLELISGSAVLIGVLLTCEWIFGSHHAFVGEKSAIMQAYVFSLARSLLPMLAGMGIATVSEWIRAWAESRIEDITVEMKNGSSEVMSYLCRLES